MTRTLIPSAVVRAWPWRAAVVYGAAGALLVAVLSLVYGGLGPDRVADALTVGLAGGAVGGALEGRRRPAWARTNPTAYALVPAASAAVAITLARVAASDQPLSVAALVGVATAAAVAVTIAGTDAWRRHRSRTAAHHPTGTAPETPEPAINRATGTAPDAPEPAINRAPDAPEAAINHSTGTDTAG